MIDLFSPRRRAPRPRPALVGLGRCDRSRSALAARVGGEPRRRRPSAVQAAAQQPAQVQADESASLRQGTIAAVDERGAACRCRASGSSWSHGKTAADAQRAAGRLESLGRARRSASRGRPRRAAPRSAMKVIYAP